jgi:hypothetical protein
MKFRIVRKLNYLKKARHRHGHGIHSPFLFRLITEVIENKTRLPEYNILRNERDQLSHLIKRKSAEVEIQTLRDSIFNLSGRKNLFKATELPLRYGRLIFRLITEFKPKSISCYGPSFGMNLLYLALPDKSTPVDFFQSDNYLCKSCQTVLQNEGVQNVSFVHNEELIDHSAEFIFMNLAFLPDETGKLIKAITAAQGENDVLIIRGIHESKQMEAIWKELIKDNKVRISLDLYEIGIILFQKKLQKEHFILRF